jgi:hypothetical protein
LSVFANSAHFPPTKTRLPQLRQFMSHRVSMTGLEQPDQEVG